ncbi:MAG: response regulator transcription factor [Clostridiales bacterium]|jgi:two-component system OmpR family response regulator|nr:response regulator transcription factor [Clostridiales bacterium]
MKTQNHRIMVVDDDPNIAQLIRLYLESEGYRVEHYLDGVSCVESFKSNPPNLVILDIMLPGMDGWDVCKEIRKVSDVPIIMLTAKGETFDKVLGLELGADDYIVKPFDPKELVARVKAVLRRSNAPGIREKIVSYPNLTVNIGNYTVEYHGETIEMPPKELELLYFLASHPNKVFTREQLLDQVWGYDFYGDTRTVDVHVKRLREKFTDPDDSWSIKTVWGVGYKFEVN